MKMNPLVTIMIPTYNQDKYIRKAVESALAQTYDNLQILVLDDCSDDNTEKIMDEFREYPKLKYIRNEENLGRVGNYRSGLYEYAEGEWVINLDGDDFFIDNFFIEESVGIIKDNEDIVIVSADRIEIDAAGSLGEYILDEDRKWTIVDGERVLMGIPDKKYQIYHLTTLYKREAAVNLDFYRKNIISSDYESLYRLLVTGKIALTDKKVAAWRKHENNESRNLSVSELIRNYELFDSVYAYLKEKDSLTPVKRWKWFVNAGSRKYYTNILTFIHGRNYGDLWKLTKFVMAEYPFSLIKTLLNPKLYIKILLAFI